MQICFHSKKKTWCFHLRYNLFKSKTNLCRFSAKERWSQKKLDGPWCVGHEPPCQGPTLWPPPNKSVRVTTKFITFSLGDTGIHKPWFMTLWLLLGAHPTHTFQTMLFKIETRHVWKPGFHVWKSEPLFLSKSPFSSSKSPTGVFLLLPKKTDNKTAPPKSCVISASKESNLQTIVGTIELQSQGLDSKVEHEAGIDQACLTESWIWSSPNMWPQSHLQCLSKLLGIDELQVQAVLMKTQGQPGQRSKSVKQLSF